MAKKGCSRQRISFTTKRGKKIVFQGRPGGDAKYGGQCPAQRKPVSQWAHLVGQAGKLCVGVGKVGSASRGACLKRQINALSK